MRCIKIFVVFLSLFLTVTPLTAVAGLNMFEGFAADIRRLNEEESQHRKAIQLNPNDADAYYSLGSVLQKMGGLDEAIAAYRKAIELKPYFADAYYSLGSVLQKRGRLDEAIAAYRKAIRLNPQFAEAYNKLGDALREEKELKEAIAAYRKAIKLNPQFAEAYNNLGLVFQEQGKLEEAIQEYQKVSKLNSLIYPIAQSNLKEAQRLLALRKKPGSLIIDDRQFVPSLQEVPLVSVLRSVVRVSAQTPTGNNVGTGWVVKREGNKAWIVTNRHVVTGSEQSVRQSEKIELEFYSDPPLGKFRPRYPANINLCFILPIEQNFRLYKFGAIVK